MFTATVIESKALNYPDRQLTGQLFINRVKFCISRFDLYWAGYRNVTRDCPTPVLLSLASSLLTLGDLLPSLNLQKYGSRAPILDRNTTNYFARRVDETASSALPTIFNMDYANLPTPPTCVADFCLIPVGPLFSEFAGATHFISCNILFLSDSLNS